MVHKLYNVISGFKELKIRNEPQSHKYTQESLSILTAFRYLNNQKQAIEGCVCVCLYVYLQGLASLGGLVFELKFNNECWVSRNDELGYF